MEEGISFSQDFEKCLTKNPLALSLGKKPGRWTIWWLTKIRRRIVFEINENYWALPLKWVA